MASFSSTLNNSCAGIKVSRASSLKIQYLFKGQELLTPSSWSSEGSHRVHHLFNGRDHSACCLNVRAASGGNSLKAFTKAKTSGPAQNLHATVQAANDHSQPRGLEMSENVWIAAGLTAAAATAAATWLFQTRKSKRPVDSLARRGLLSADRLEEFHVIQEFEDPTRVLSYQVGNVELKEVDYLSPLTEEKRKQHREARMAEHGWKKLEIVLVEGDPIPEGVDEKAVRFIPRKHPFAMSQDEMSEEWSEEVVKRRLSQRRGLPEKDKRDAKKRLEMYRQQERDAQEGPQSVSRERRGGRIGGGDGGPGSAVLRESAEAGRGNAGLLGSQTSLREAGENDQHLTGGSEGGAGVAPNEGGRTQGESSRGGLQASEALALSWNSGQHIGNVGAAPGGGTSKPADLDMARDGGAQRSGQLTDAGHAFGWSAEFLPPACDEEVATPRNR